MPYFTPEQIEKIMSVSDQIRNLSVIAHVDTGKTTVTDSLVSRAGIIPDANAGHARIMDTRDDEQDRIITIKSTGISLYFSRKGAEGEDNTPYLINLIDSPGHVDFSSEVTAALRITDGALVIIDCIRGVGVQTETVLRQALQERVKPVLFINKVDRNIVEQMLPEEDIYQKFVKEIDNVNMLISAYGGDMDWSVSPQNGSVSFGCGLQGWGFNLNMFARLYGPKMGLKEEQMMKYLWGDWFCDVESGKFVKSQYDDKGNQRERVFCRLVLKPIKQMYRAFFEVDTPEAPEAVARQEKFAAKQGVVLKRDDKDKPFKERFETIMKKWLHLSECVLEMVVTHLPSPKVAQKYRTELLYSGDITDKYAESMRNCDPDGPLSVFISKMVPDTKTGKFIAYGRVFSGTVKAGKKLRIMGPEYKPGEKKDLSISAPQRVVLMMGRNTEKYNAIPVGNTVGLLGLDGCIVKTATLTEEDNVDASPLKNMEFSVSPVVRVAVEAKNAADLDKMVKGIRKLIQSDPLLKYIQTRDGEHVLAGAGELHLEIAVKDLRDDYAKGVDIRVSDPVVPYTETISETSNHICLAKSPNKHNRLYVSAEPLSGELVADIESGDFNPNMETKERNRILVEKYGWDKVDASRIWFFGPDREYTNVFVNVTSGVQYLDEIKDSIKNGFNWAVGEGVLAGEPVKGVRFNLHDVTLHADAIHRGMGQLLPTARRVMYAAMLCAGPTLNEPIYRIEVNCPADVLNAVHSHVSQKRGYIDEEEHGETNPMCTLKGYLPVANSFGFTGDLRGKTGGKAFPTCSFDHWEKLTGDASDEKSSVYEIVMDIRKRKKLGETYPDISKFEDKL